MKHNLIQSVSNLFHPLFSITWAMLVLVFFTPLCILPMSYRWVMLMEAAFYSFLLPSIIIIILAKLGFVKNGVALHDRADRVIPLGIQTILYGIQAYVFAAQGLPSCFMFVFYGAFILAVVFFVVTYWWKMSAHAGCNAALSTVALIMFYEHPSLMPLIIPLSLIVMTGAVGSIRVYLERHTLSQVAVGAFAGSFCMALSFFIFA